jgi:phage gp36-like protein
VVKIKALEQTISFYKWELEKKELTEKERDKYLKALKIIEKIIKGKERSGEKRKDKRFIEGSINRGEYKGSGIFYPKMCKRY